jgi:hypothetical protein
VAFAQIGRLWASSEQSPWALKARQSISQSRDVSPQPADDHLHDRADIGYRENG